MKTYSVIYKDRSLDIAFPGGPAEAATHAHEAIEAVRGIAAAIGSMHREHAKGRVDFTDELAEAISGLQFLASLAVILDLQRVTAEVTA